MKLSEFKALSLEQIVDVFHDLYGDENKRRTVFNIWLHIAEHASSVGEALRKDEIKEAFCATARVFGWFCSFVAKCYLDEDAESVFKIKKKLSKIVWNKYPRLCTVCTTFPCHCLTKKREIEKKKTITEGQKRIIQDARDLGLPPNNLSGWAKMFKAIYGNYHYATTLECIGFHFLEEIGEVAKSIVDLQEKKDSGKLEELMENMENELADVFSWLFAVVLKLRFISESVAPLYGKTKRIELSTIVWKAYEKDFQTLKLS